MFDDRLARSAPRRMTKRMLRQVKSNIATESAFLDSARGIIDTPPSPLARYFVIGVAAAFLVALIGAILGQVEIYAVADGRIQAPGRSKVVQSPDGGTVARLLVSEGGYVHAGQPLLLLDRTDAISERGSLAAQIEGLEGEVARRTAAIEAVRLQKRSAGLHAAYPDTVGAAVREEQDAALAADVGQLEASVASLRAKAIENETQIRALRTTISDGLKVVETMNRRLTMRSDLATEGWDSQSSVLDAREEAQKQITTLSTQRGQIEEFTAENSTLQRQIDGEMAKFVADNADSVVETQTKISDLRQQLAKASAKLHRTTISSPSTGYVQEVSVTTIGQVITPGQQIMTVVPGHSSLQVEAMVLNRDIGFVQSGQRVTVKVETFPYTRFGTLAGRVSHVSHDAVNRQEAENVDSTQATAVKPQSSASSPTPSADGLVFPVIVDLDRDTMDVYGKKVPLSDGMRATVEIETGRRSVIDYVFSPIVDAVSSSFHER